MMLYMPFMDTLSVQWAKNSVLQLSSLAKLCDGDGDDNTRMMFIVLSF